MRSVQRATDEDLAFLAMEVGPVPEHFAVIVVLDGDIAEQALGRRIATVPRLLQRLRRLPPGFGRPVWEDDPAFDLSRHVRRIHCPAPGDEAALYGAATAVVVEALPRDRPLWRAVVVDGLSGGGSAVVIVVHHAVADGLGGLAILGQLADDAGAVPADPPATSPARLTELAVDAWRTRFSSLPHLGRGWRDLRAGMAAEGGLRHGTAARCSLNRPVGAHRVMRTVEVKVFELRRGAHLAGGSVNAALVAAVSGALGRLLAARNERLDAVAIAVPASGRSAAAAKALGNLVTPLLITVPTGADPAVRVRQVAEAVGRQRGTAVARSPVAVLGALFRCLAMSGGYRWYMRHQHRVHTVVAYVRGPDRPIRLCGREVRKMLPLGVSETGNITVAFQALSYAGRLTVSAVADPNRCPDLGMLIMMLEGELSAVTALYASAHPGPPRSSPSRADTARG